MAGLLRTPWWAKLGIFVTVLAGAYALGVVVLGFLAVNRHAPRASEGAEIFLTTNGVHAALVLPTGGSSTGLARDLFPAGAAPTATHVMIGWGDARIYPATRVWSDLGVLTTLRGLVGLNGAVVQAVPMPRPSPGASVVPIRLAADDYARLLAHVQGALQRDAEGRPIRVEGAGHGVGDAFYAAHGRFNLFRTCNEWVREALAAAGVRTAMWSPLDRPLFWHVRR